MNVIIKLAIQDNEAKMKSSVITLYPMSDKRLRRLINKSRLTHELTGYQIYYKSITKRIFHP